jgi:predicted nucleic acid-binding protein
MAPPIADRAVVDTNVLLAASDEARAKHQAALAVLNTWPASGVALYTSGQIIREYLAVATRPVRDNGLGMDRPAALANARAFRTRLRLISEDSKVADRLLEILESVNCSGKQVHDANVVASMLVTGVQTVVTSNVNDFAKFSHLIRAVHP